MAKTTAILQARMGSSRLPGKSLMDIEGYPLVKRAYDRLSLADTIDQVVLAVPDTQAHDALSDYAKDRGWKVYRGPEDDVLARYVGTAIEFNADPIVRATADCPLLDPGIVKAVVALFKSGEFDYASNNLEATFPHGTDVECFSRATLDAMDGATQDCYEREHVTEYAIRHPEKFRQGNLKCEYDLSSYRWTVDYPEDMAAVRAIYHAFRHRTFFTSADIIELWANRPELRAINAERVAKIA